MKEPTQSVIRKIASTLVLKEDIDRFMALAREDLAHLHEGNLARYRLRPNEYQAWRHLQREAN